VGGVIPHRGSLVLQQPEQLKKRFNIDVHLRTEATAINRDTRTVSVKNLETGLAPRRARSLPRAGCSALSTGPGHDERRSHPG
jgi:NADPH-dependent 2,4-dienoyl-CoA reductase/sulfur reductase-like enzyme